MHSKELDRDDARSFVLVLDTGEDVMEALLAFVHREDIRSGHFTAIGALEHATLAFFDPELKRYEELPVDEQVEVLVMAGNIAETEDGETKVHAHAVLGMRDGSTRGGHVLHARVRPTLEVVITASAGRLARRVDPESGLPLLAP
jgi:uncharacterized protein